ncbi:hypothetical protein ENHAE0001_2007 [Enhydrobacter aerosaccus SK60]|nr:hypothetical protein ENHAE0001_2007 [Enhydrobacter aerosaccus SK60]
MVKIALSKIATGGTNFVVSKTIKKPYSNRLSRVKKYKLLGKNR